jgi:hypothetical protein
MDGARLILELRRQPGREHLAAVLMTGARNVLLPERVAFVQKPFLLSRLVSAAGAALETAEQSSALAVPTGSAPDDLGVKEPTGTGSIHPPNTPGAEA